TVKTRSAVRVADLQAVVLAESKARFPDEYPIGITDCRLRESYSSAFDTDGAVVTTHAKAKAAPNYSLQRYLIYHVVDILMSRYIDLPFHENAVGCVDDYLNTLEDMQVGVTKSEYCPACRRKIIAAVSAGQISLQKVAAIFRMLDFAANRRRCFVLMPFDPMFHDVYKRGVKPAMTRAGWDCARADEIFQSREVMTIVWEEILRAELVVADLTGRNANVYYELGFAHALSKNTILLAQDIGDVPFDLRHRQLVQYSSTRAGHADLQRAIQKYL
ncbi:MAG TPA: hypothetical protein VF713_27545, partial [Thermoanaerobaculia bacterium]